MVDVALLASQVAVTLGPALPFLLGKAEGGAIGEAGKKLGTQAWELAQALWSRLHPHIAGNPAAQQMVAQVAEDPTAAGAEAALGFQLQALLKADLALAEELDRLLKSAGPAGTETTVTASGERSVAVGGGITGSRIQTGDTQYGDRFQVGDISGSQGLAIGRAARAEVHGNIIADARAVNPETLRMVLTDLQAALGRADLPTEAKLVAQTAAGNAVLEGVVGGEVKPDVVVPQVEKIGAVLKRANVAVQEGSALWESVQKLATTVGPLVQGGAQVVGGWFGVPLPL
jgi:hypothetical protein